MSDDKELTPEELKTKLEETQAQLKRVNAESAERRKKLEAHEAEKAKLEAEKLSEAEKLQAQITAIKTEQETTKKQLHAERVRNAIIAEATKLGFASPEDAIALTDLSEVTVIDGKVTGFEKSLKALAEGGRLPMADQRQSDKLGTPLRASSKSVASKSEPPEYEHRL